MNPYGAKVDGETIRRPLVSLKVLYDGMPETTGCEKCSEVNGDDAHWCCCTMNPSMYYIEFIKVWQHVQNTWGRKKKINLFVRAIENYLFMGQGKGCIFFDDGCRVYDQRPFYCRMYGIIPKDSWDSRIEAIKKRDEDFEFRPQCELVETKEGVTEEDEDKWFAHVKQCEEKLVPAGYIKLHDIPGGCYRTFHDHLLLEVLEPSTMNVLTGAKMSKPTKGDISLLKNELLKLLEQGKLIKL